MSARVRNLIYKQMKMELEFLKFCCDLIGRMEIEDNELIEKKNLLKLEIENYKIYI